MDNRTIASLIVIILTVVLLRFLLRLAVMMLGYFIFYVIPLILINILFLLMWVIRPDILYADIKLFFNDKKLVRLGLIDFIDRLFFIPVYNSKKIPLRHF